MNGDDEWWRWMAIAIDHDSGDNEWFVCSHHWDDWLEPPQVHIIHTYPSASSLSDVIPIAGVPTADNLSLPFFSLLRPPPSLSVRHYSYLQCLKLFQRGCLCMHDALRPLSRCVERYLDVSTETPPILGFQLTIMQILRQRKNFPWKTKENKYFLLLSWSTAENIAKNARGDKFQTRSDVTLLAALKPTNIPC